MNGTAPFRLNHGVLVLALISAAFAGNASASAGRVDFTIGGVVATRPDGQQRALSKGQELESGDTIRTNDGRAQIRFPDGAYVSLQPNTVFGIKEYNYDGKPDGTERGFFSLLKGAMRAVTGLIGRVNRSTYQISTPTATVGIRGTGGLIVVLPDGSTLIRGSSGIWSLSNASGSIDIPAGTSGLAPADPSTPPQETNGIPSVPPAPPGAAGDNFIAGDLRTGTGDPIVPTIVPLQSGNGYAAAVAYSDDGDGYYPLLIAGLSTSATFNASGQLTEILSVGGNYSFGIGTGSHAEFGTDGILAWGRWIGSTLTGSSTPTDPLPYSGSYGPNQGLHYVVGMPTPAMPTTGSAIYTLLGATSPTYIDGRTAPGIFAGSLEVVFGQANPHVTMAFSVSMPDGNTYLVNGPASTYSGAVFSGNPSVGSGGGNACTSGCSSYVQGFFAGANAARAGVGYQISDNLNSADIVGAAAFKNTGVPVPQ